MLAIKSSEELKNSYNLKKYKHYYTHEHYTITIYMTVITDLVFGTRALGAFLQELNKRVCQVNLRISHFKQSIRCLALGGDSNGSELD